MRRFRFRLAPLLRLRAQFERSARRELATAMAAVAAVERQIEAARASLRDCADQAARGDSVGRFARSLEAGLRRHQFRLERQRVDAERRLDAVRADYAQKARDRRTLERLRDQQRDAHRQALQRAEQAELDELAALARGAAAAVEAEA